MLRTEKLFERLFMGEFNLAGISPFRRKALMTRTWQRISAKIGSIAARKSGCR